VITPPSVPVEKVDFVIEAPAERIDHAFVAFVASEARHHDFADVGFAIAVRVFAVIEMRRCSDKHAPL